MRQKRKWKQENNSRVVSWSAVNYCGYICSASIFCDRKPLLCSTPLSFHRRRIWDSRSARVTFHGHSGCRGWAAPHRNAFAFSNPEERCRGASAALSTPSVLALQTRAPSGGSIDDVHAIAKVRSLMLTIWLRGNPQGSMNRWAVGNPRGGTIWRVFEAPGPSHCVIVGPARPRPQ